MNGSQVKRELKRKLEQYRQLVRELGPSDTTASELLREYVGWLEEQLSDLEV